MSTSMAHRWGRGRAIERVGVAVVQRAVEHAGTSIEALYGSTETLAA